MKRFALALALSTPVAAAAADAPQGEVFAGYSHARHDTQETDGFLAGLDLSLGRSFGVELAVARQYASVADESLSWTSLLAGPRYAWWGDSVTPFVSVQGGVERRTARAEVFDVDISLSETKLAGAATAGLEVSIGSRWAARAQLSALVRESFPDESVEEDAGVRWDPQASLAVVYRFGKR
jgi:hypothetical protein